MPMPRGIPSLWQRRLAAELEARAPVAEVVALTEQVPLQHSDLFGVPFPVGRVLVGLNACAG
jgi:hypothetical protein